MSEFFAQGGYAFYVWCSYGAGALLLIMEIVQLRRKRRTILSRASRLVRMRAEVNDES